MLWYWCQEAAVPVDYANNVSLACFRWFAVPASCLLKLLMFPASQSMFTRKGAWIKLFCEMLVLSSELMPQLFFKQAVLETDRDSEADVISTKGVHPGGRGFSECTLSASASSSMCSVCSKIGQALQRFPVVRSRFSAHWSQADGVQKVMHCLA